MGARYPADSGAAPPGAVSRLNSSETALAGAATFTGEWEDLLDFAGFSVACKVTPTNASGALYVDFSNDGVTADVSGTASYPTDANGSIGVPHMFSRTRRYFRVRFINGATQQDTLRLQVILNRTPMMAIPTLRLDASINDRTDIIPVRQVSDPILDEARGHSDMIQVGKFGRNPDVAAATEEDIWALGGSYTGWLTAASAIRIKAGGSANDTAAGSGARSVVVQGLDANWAPASETITTNGASASTATSTTFIRVYRAYVDSVGTYGGTNAAAITIETTGGATMANIPAGLGQTMMSMYTVPAGYTAYLRSCEINVGSSKFATVYLWQRQNADDVSSPYTGKRLIQGFSEIAGRASTVFQSLRSFPAKTDLWASAIGPTGNGPVDANYDLVLVAD